MKPQSHEEHIRHTFDAFCKKVLRNEARDYLDEIARKRSREISLSQSATCSMKCMLATLQRRYALLGNQRENPANTLLQSHLMAI